MHEQELAVAQDAARAAGAMIQDRLLADHDVDRKGAHTDIVTEVDRRCQDRIIEEIQETFPDAAFLAEEVDTTPDADRYWVIDPLDATANYHHRFPVYCNSIALVEDGETVVGVVYDPARDELFHAVRGGGAYCNDESITVSGIKDLEDGLVITRISDREPGLVERETAFVRELLSVPVVFRRIGCAALALCWVGAGRAEAYALASIHAWDIAAGRLIVQEADGRVREQEPAMDTTAGIELVASNGAVHHAVTERFDRTIRRQDG